MVQGSSMWSQVASCPLGGFHAVLSYFRQIQVAPFPGGLRLFQVIKGGPWWSKVVPCRPRLPRVPLDGFHVVSSCFRKVQVVQSPGGSR